MENELSIRLIDGQFDVEEANLLLMELLRFKIDFHDKRLFNNYAQHSHDSANSRKRIEELGKALNLLRRYMATAKAGDEKLAIDCHIHIRKTT